MNVGEKLRAYLTKRDGSVSRTGEAMLALKVHTRYSTEALRSFAYGRREPAPGKRRDKLVEKIRRG